MTDKQLMQETENNIEIATKALADAAVTAKELRIEMEERVPKIIHTTYALFEDDSARAQKAVLEMGYTKEEIRTCGHEVN